jgi:hypothetical protein
MNEKRQNPGGSKTFGSHFKEERQFHWQTKFGLEKGEWDDFFFQNIGYNITGLLINCVRSANTNFFLCDNL